MRVMNGVLLVAFLVGCSGGGGGAGTNYGTVVEDSFDDGEFTSNPTWTLQNDCGAGTCSSVVIDDDTPPGNKAIQVTRSGSGMSGGIFAVKQDLTAAIPDGDLHLYYRIKLLYDQLGSGSNDCSEWAGHIWLGLELADASTTTFHAAHSNIGGGCANPNGVWQFTTVPLGAWQQYDVNVSEAISLAGLAAPERVTLVMVGGNGWDFDVVFDQIEVLTTPPVE